jgi:hypothetical protein
MIDLLRVRSHRSFHGRRHIERDVERAPTGSNSRLPGRLDGEGAKVPLLGLGPASPFDPSWVDVDPTLAIA